jgi:hypothetical protein
LSNSPSPKAAKAVRVLLGLAKVLGWATHKDADGTFKLPLQEIVAFVVAKMKKAPGTAALILFIIATVAACATAKKVAYDAAACAVGQVPSAVADTVAEATASLTGAGAETWAEFAKGDLLKHGIDAAICIVEAALHDIDNTMSSAKGQLGENIVAGHQLGVQWLAQHGVKHVHDARATPDGGAQ